ncbi:Spo0E like sporulation regulatory protein [Cytobacillus horneckiae]|uniref:aspartyl-phosphate phosphatase Spo0E family protein n=1 Tax=Cytobacillus horneckiae TaxID=549687 RepID=UPI001562A378|nr:aspartyl-phosphate phosphatase Spo0E family protein [Cytobacillus horneckiae]MBN6889840.1 aspartyl-phosphate phosphatase Spo0E family protein [Cytobacillus horneckiae]NRG45599.1 aspartyl-phosphate phosphatase Spo0E family protein [Bacillus sp. CRN 9]
MHVNELLRDIEIHRSRMIELASTNSFSHHQVLEASIKLDSLIIRYHTLTLKNEA